MGIVTWTPEKDERLRVLAVNHTHRQIGVILGHTQGAVASRCEALGIRRKSGRAPKFAWTPELDAAIKDADAAQVKCAPTGPVSVFQWGQR